MGKRLEALVLGTALMAGVAGCTKSVGGVPRGVDPYPDAITADGGPIRPNDGGDGYNLFDGSDGDIPPKCPKPWLDCPEDGGSDGSITDGSTGDAGEGGDSGSGDGSIDGGGMPTDASTDADGGGSPTDAGPGDGGDAPINYAPTIELGFEERNIRTGTLTSYNPASFSDPNGDPLDFRYEFDSLPDETNIYTRNWDSNDEVSYSIESPGDYRLRARVRDSLGLEGIADEATLHAYINIPPHAVLACEEYAADGLCIHRFPVNTVYCWDASGSYDEDGTIAEIYFYFGPLFGGGFAPDSGVLCGEFFNTPGSFSSSLTVTDNDGTTDTQEFYNIVE